MTTANLTAKETAVMQALYTTMQGNGFDFGFRGDVANDEAVKAAGMTAKQAGATLRELHKKFKIEHDSETDQIYVCWNSEAPDYSADFETFVSAIAAR